MHLDTGAPHEAAPQDREAASRYVNARAGLHFLACRRRLRSILSDYTGTPAGALQFRQGRYGKLHLRQHGGRRVHFNISHSRDRLLIGVSCSGPVGVDVEHVRPIDAGWLAQNWFSGLEYRQWRHVPRVHRLEAFFHGWTRKEAFLKATGFGMAMPLDSFSVSLDPGRAELLEVGGGAPRAWRLSRLELGAECAAALVTFGDPGAIRMMEAA